MGRQKLRAVGIPEDLFITVEKFLEKYPRYVSVSEFVREAIREKLAALENNLKVPGGER